MAVGDERGDDEVDDPKHCQDTEGEPLGLLGPAQLAADGRAATQHQQHHSEEGHDAKDGDGEGQRAGVDVELVAVGVVVDGRHAPRDADAQEDVDSVGARHVADGRVGVAVVDGRHLAGERVCTQPSNQPT